MKPPLSSDRTRRLITSVHWTVNQRFVEDSLFFSRCDFTTVVLKGIDEEVEDELEGLGFELVLVLE